MEHKELEYTCTADSFFLEAVIILAGGQGKRLGGYDKGSIIIKEKRSIDWILLDLVRLFPTAVPIVVSPHKYNSSNSLLTVMEDPPGSGPAAGIYTATEYWLEKRKSFLRTTTKMEAIDSDGMGMMGVVPVDSPTSIKALSYLFQYVNRQKDNLPSAMVAVAEEILQPCIAVFKPLNLISLVNNRGINTAVRKLWNLLGYSTTIIPDSLAKDIDTWQDLNNYHFD